MALIASTAVKGKLSAKKPPVSELEIIQCFANREGRYLVDDREKNRTSPQTQWFISETDSGRSLKIVFIQKSQDIVIKTAFVPNTEEFRIYKKFGSLK